MKAAPIITPITNGNVSEPARKAIKQVLRNFEGKTVRIEISQNRKKRSCKQNAFYFGVVLPIVSRMFNESGNDANQETIHTFLKGNIGGMKKAIVSPDGEVLWQVESSVKMSTADFEEWLEKIRAWAAPFGVEIPFPNEGAM